MRAFTALERFGSGNGKGALEFSPRMEHPGMEAMNGLEKIAQATEQNPL